MPKTSYSGFSACSRLKSRAISDQIRTLSDMWTDVYKQPKRITADSEYDKSQFRDYYNNMDCELVIVATEAHHQNGTIESGNRVLRMVFRRIRLAEKQLVLS